MERGLYETLLTEALKTQLDDLAPPLAPTIEDLHWAEAPDRIAMHLAQVVRWTMQSLPDDERVERGVSLLRELMEKIGAVTGIAELAERQVVSGQVLRAILGVRPDGQREQMEPPLTPLLDTTLLTNAPDEPRVGRQLLTEIASADGIDVVMAFVRRTGIRPLLDALRRHCERGAPLRLLTTTFTQTTELAALEQLRDLGANIRVSYDTSVNRLHAKAWLFRRSSGFSTAYVGSSNLTFSAQQSGLEWNVRISGARNPDVIEKIAAVFESYWQSRDFVPFDSEQFAAAVTGAQRDGNHAVRLSPIELRPMPFQDRLLEQIEVSRQLGHHRNLLVAATGTGKTVMAAIDYARLRQTLPRARLLFVAHRGEILEQSLATFRHALRDAAFGELWVGGQRPRRFEHVFASIQSLHANGLEHLPPDHFDVVIVDEFHHAAATTYRELLGHVQPRELLGLTATPERSDGLSILHWFDGRIAAELRLWHAIEQQRLCPFLYYGISDAADLRAVPWRRGRGYDTEGLTRALTADEALARNVLHQLRDHVDDLARIRCLAFCVSVAHARFMARVFAEGGMRAVAVWGDSPASEREAALRQLASGAIQVVFSVDLFNEGVDVPNVDTVLFLRPTDSPTLFLQQLGRGLRTSPGKTACTVLDFVGQHCREFRFDRRFGALFEGGRRRLMDHVQRGFPFLPAGCHMELDAVAQQRVLENIRAVVPSRWKEKAAELRRVAAAAPGRPLSLSVFLDETGLDLEDVYQGNYSWSDLLAAAGMQIQPPGPLEEELRRACGRLAHVDDLERLDRYRTWLASPSPPDTSGLTERERRSLRMLVGSIVGRFAPPGATLTAGAELLWQHRQVCAELVDLFDVLTSRVDHVHHLLSTHADVPMQIHARYTRVEMLAAFGVGGDLSKVESWQTGVRSLPESHADICAFTLDKTSGTFSPTTRYRDYAISPGLLHWESQSKDRADSKRGLHYRNHVEEGSHILLFARLRQSDRSFWFLGPASYVSHTSECPMQITWRLHHELPGDLFAAFAAAVA